MLSVQQLNGLLMDADDLTIDQIRTLELYVRNNWTMDSEEVAELLRIGDEPIPHSLYGN